MTNRPSGRKYNQLRDVDIKTDVNMHAEGSALITAGNTKVICTASVEQRVPSWLKGGDKGWVTAEYGMLPRATGSRMNREAKKGQSGRTQEIQRLIGRALRAVVDLEKIKDISIKVDCDVIQADGGTRTASITGAYVALYQAFEKLVKAKVIDGLPIKEPVMAISCGIYKDEPVLDLDYIEDSNACADANFVLTKSGKIVEIQGTAEEDPFSQEDFLKLLGLAQSSIKELWQAQEKALKG